MAVFGQNGFGMKLDAEDRFGIVAQGHDGTILIPGIYTVIR